MKFEVIGIAQAVAVLIIAVVIQLEVVEQIVSTALIAALYNKKHVNVIYVSEVKIKQNKKLRVFIVIWFIFCY